MTQKRPFVGDDPYEVSFKHPRQLDHIDQLSPILSLDDLDQKPLVSGVDNFFMCGDVGRSSNDLASKSSSGVDKDFETGFAGCFPNFLWINNDNLSLFPEYFDHGYQMRALLQPDEIYSPLDSPFRKPVSIGPEHQAFVPEWGSQCLSTSSNKLDKYDSQVAFPLSSGPVTTDDDHFEERLMGHCVMPMPVAKISARYHCEGTMDDCSCPDGGSIRCVRQHIMEAREKLRENLGEEVFEGLGFCDMGEEVASRWTEKEEQTFNGVVHSNPKSLGNNFWNHLSVPFPSRTKEELVSYYFNVFMLQKRAEQNRFDPHNIDSDDDEWQRSDHISVEEYEDSAVESPTCQDAYYKGDHAENYHDETEDGNETGASRDSDGDFHRVTTDEEYEGDVDAISGAHIRASADHCDCDTGFKHSSEVCSNIGEDCDNQYDSCTSYECQRDNADGCGLFDAETDRRQSTQLF